jgi:hypothetical protein
MAWVVPDGKYARLGRVGFRRSTPQDNRRHSQALGLCTGPRHETRGRQAAGQLHGRKPMLKYRVPGRDYGGFIPAHPFCTLRASCFSSSPMPFNLSRVAASARQAAGGRSPVHQQRPSWAPSWYRLRCRVRRLCSTSRAGGPSAHPRSACSGCFERHGLPAHRLRQCPPRRLPLRSRRHLDLTD